MHGKQNNGGGFRRRNGNNLLILRGKTKALEHPKAMLLAFGAALLMVFTYFAFALPVVTFVSPTLQDNVTTGSNWAYINLTSSEPLNQSLLEWGNSSGFTNVSMTNVSGMTNWYVNMTDLADGAYNYTIFAQNTTGDWNQTGRRFVTVDTAPPTEPTLISPANNTNSTDNTPDLDWTTVTEQNFRNYTVQADDNSTFSSPNYIYSTTAITESNYSITSAWADGKWYWRVRAYDNAGNSNTSGYFVYTVDTSGPTITLDAPRNGSVMRNGTWINLTITDLTGVNVSWWSNDTGATNYTLTSPWDINTTGWSEGDKAIEVWANDSFGFLRRNTYFFRIDDTPPYNTTACQNLDIAGGYYILAQNVSSSGTCFNILANNITLDGGGYWVKYSQSIAGYGISNTAGYDNITVRNINIQQNSSLINSAGIYSSGMINSNINNTNIQTSGEYSHGIYDEYGNGNHFFNNSVNILGNYAKGFFLSADTQYSILNNIINTTGSYADGIFLGGDAGTTYTNISDNIISTWGPISNGIIIYEASDSNVLINNSVNVHGVNSPGMHIDDSINNIIENNVIYSENGAGFKVDVYTVGTNNVSNGSIISKNSNDYLVNYNIGATKFKNTNFTSTRKISFVESTSRFYYSNDSYIWLNTNVSAPVIIIRTLINWSQSQMKWNDTNSTAGITANYSLTGLQVSVQYKIYNTSQGIQTNSYTLTTDSIGALSFTIALNGNTEIIVNTSAGIDNIPVVSALNSPANNSNFTTGIFWLNATGYDDFNLTAMELNVWNSTSLANQTNITNPANNTMVGVQVTLSNGTYRWNYRAYDNASQTGWYSSNYTFTIDGVPPTSNAPNDASYSQGDTATIGWILQDNYAPGYYKVYRNGTTQNQSTWTNSTSLNIWVNTSAQGTWNYTITYNDSLGNNGNPDNVIITITGDTTPPTITIQSPSNTTYAQKWVWANASLNEAGSWCGVSLNNTANQTLSNTSTTAWYLNLTVPAEGSNSVKFYCNDTAGNTNSTNVTFTISSPPVISVQSPLNQTYNTVSIWFNITANEALNWSAYSLDGAANITLTNSSGNWNNLSTIAEGFHNVTFYANDTAGNMNSSVARYFTVDITAPSVIISLPQNTTYNSVSRTLNYTATDGGSGINTTWYQYNGTNTTLSGNISFTALNNQQSTLILYANDSAGNVNSTNVTFTISSPTVISVQSPLNQTYATNSVWFNITMDKAGSWAGYSLDGSANISLTNSTGNWNNLSTVAEGFHNVTFYANDTTGNMNSSVARYFTVDTTPPVLTFVNITPNNTQTNSSWAYINITSSESLSSALLEWNLTQNLTMSGSGTNWYYNKTGLANGNYTFKVYANDSAGNWNSTETRWVYANYTSGHPQYSNISVNATQRNSSALFTAYWTDDIGLSLFIFSTNNSGSWANYTGNFSGTGNWSNHTITLNNTIGLSIGYIFYANNTNSNWNNTGIQTLVTGCLESWSYSEWSACSGSVQTRTASDSNTCGTTINRSALSQSCTSAASEGGTSRKSAVSASGNDIAISVNLNTAVPNPSISATIVASVPVPIDNAYQYLNITKSNFNDSQIENATIEFKVNKSWILANSFTNISLARYEGGWSRLKTDLVNSTGEQNIYKAYTDKFSYFAIMGETKPLICTENWSCSEWSVCADNRQIRICRDLNNCNTSASKPAESHACKTIAETPPIKELPIIYIVIIAGILLAAAAFVFRKKMLERMQGFFPRTGKR